MSLKGMVHPNVKIIMNYSNSSCYKPVYIFGKMCPTTIVEKIYIY